MEIRRAKLQDIPEIDNLLYQVHGVHAKGRPDIFRDGCKKYTNEELTEIIQDDNRPIFVYVDNQKVLGYAFCINEDHRRVKSWQDFSSLYIDDLCVDKEHRGRGIGKTLYNHVLAYAKDNGYYNVTLNVWACNKEAMVFYEKCGLTIQKIGMEKILK